MNIILASASPRRHELMKLITDDFIVAEPDFEEVLPDNFKGEPAEYFAEGKAKSVAKRFPDDIVIGCDTVVKIEDKILGKPKDANECRKYLKMLSGRKHWVTTYFCIICKDRIISSYKTTAVSFRNLSDDDIEQYIATGEPFDKAGGYGIQGKGALLVNVINGDYFNVVGLPVSELNQKLKNFIKEI